MTNREPNEGTCVVPYGLVLLLWPAVAYASDMTALVFLYTFPVCVGLVVLTFVLAAVVAPRAGGLLLVPIGALIGIHVYLLPEMVHAAEIQAFAVQALVSSLSLLALRIVDRRRRRASKGAAPASERGS